MTKKQTCDQVGIASVAVIQEAWVSGVSTRRVDDLVQAIELAGISKSTVSKLCKDIYESYAGTWVTPLIRRRSVLAC